jgi:hypothetical protein
MTIDAKQTLTVLAIVFVILSMWSDPQGSGQAMGDFLGSVGDFLAGLTRKLVLFLSGLTNSS